jgi:hypothetical protein
LAGKTLQISEFTLQEWNDTWKNWISRRKLVVNRVVQWTSERNCGVLKMIFELSWVLFVNMREIGPVYKLPRYIQYSRIYVFSIVFYGTWNFLLMVGRALSQPIFLIFTQCTQEGPNIT